MSDSVGEVPYQRLFESAPGLYLVLSPDLHIVAVTEAYLNATMTQRENILGRPLFEVFPDNPDEAVPTGTRNLRASLERVIKSLKPDTMAIQKYDIRKPDGKTFEVRYWSPVNTPVKNKSGALEYIIHRVEDVTEFVRAKEQETKQFSVQEALRTRAEQMEAEIYRSAQEVQDANRQLRAMNEELESFSYSVSHDLRAPLRALSGFSLALEEDFGDKLDETAKSYLKSIKTASIRMATLIDDLLSLSRVTREQMLTGSVKLSELASHVFDDVRKQDPKRNVEFIVAPDVITKGDPRLLRVALENLLGNAWKFSSRNPEARIEFGVVSNDGATRYFIRDNGAGFDMKYIKKLFGAFQRLHHTSEFPGSGIGLAIVKRVISRHGGDVSAEGEVNKGATFYFTLPL